MGQTFELPATVIAQSDRGAVTVLAAFASPEMSLRRHVETFVKPWLVAHCPWVFSDRRLLLGVVEEIETEAQCNFVQTLNELLGGSWNPVQHPWESRRDSMLDVFGKVQGLHYEAGAADPPERCTFARGSAQRALEL